ncbi:helix-turn-helix domain-containing protein [Ktedonobacter sp. SOSP1-85]|uniref:helix-turn-helix domain-containing protein n=1 Tax=Ktedonobacter sp. SOSP1-85 TaxID=2778367 RepID=UPI0019155EE6
MHRETVRQWIREKQLQAVNSGRRGGYRIRRSDVHEFLRKRETIQDDDSSSSCPNSIYVHTVSMLISPTLPTSYDRDQKAPPQSYFLTSGKD